MKRGPAKNLGYRNASLFMPQVEKISKLSGVYTASILDSGPVEFPGGNPIQQGWLLTSDSREGVTHILPGLPGPSSSVCTRPRS